MSLIFQNPQLLVLLIVLIPVGFYIRKGCNVRERVLKSFTGNFISHSTRYWIVLIASIIFLSSLLLLAAGPKRLLNTEANLTANFIFLIDVSRSMAARVDCNDDTRLDRVKSIMTRIVSGLPGAGFAFSGFSGLTFVLSEMSYDRQYLLDLIANGIFIEVIPYPGSDIANAMHVLMEKKTRQPPVYAGMNNVILFSDGDIAEEFVDELYDLAPLLRDAEFEVTSIGIGSDEIIPIPTLDENRECITGQFERANGKEFYTNLFESPLRKIAEDTGGKYFHETQQNEIVEYLKTKLANDKNIIPPQQTEDASLVFLILSTLSFLALIAVRQL
jgi:hypothetical protein